MNGKTLLSIIIPTKNRPNDLKKSIKSLLLQSRLPDELIVVDQSKNFKSKVEVYDCLLKYPSIRLIYLCDKSLRGLVDAKRRGVCEASGDIICFMEDDVILESNYLEEILMGFESHPKMLGCCGIVTNPPKKSLIYKALFHFFHIGIFRDKRIGLNYFSSEPIKKPLIVSDKLSGGISAWRKEIFKSIDFDIENEFHMLEDIDFSTRVAELYGEVLFINPNVRLAHYCSPINRESLNLRQKRKLIETFMYFKKRKRRASSALFFSWLLLGMLLEAIYESLSTSSLKPMYGYFEGLFHGLRKKLKTQ